MLTLQPALCSSLSCAAPSQADDTLVSELRTMSRPSHCRGLAQASARIGFNTCARQVRAAIDDVLLEKYEMPHSWAEASERHQLLYTDRPTRLRY